MKTPKIELRLAGSVQPPKDMVAAARKSLGNRYQDFVAKYPGEVTPQKLCKFMEEL